MEKTIMCLYYSKTGSCLEYATYLEEEYGIDICDVRDIKFKYFNADILIYIAPLRANKILKLDILEKNSKFLGKTKLIILPVGIFQDSKEYEETLIKENLNKSCFSQASLHYMRGCLDTSQLNFIERRMINTLYNRIAVKEKLSKDEDDLLYNVCYKISYVSNYYLFPVIEEIKKELE